MKIWVTKFSLTQGILEIEAKECPGFPGMVEEVQTKPQNYFPKNYFYGEGREWHRTEQDAIALALQIGTKKITALKDQIWKIEADHAVWINRRDELRRLA